MKTQTKVPFYLLVNFVLNVSLSAGSISEEALVTDLVYLDIDINGQEAGKIVIGLFGATTPKTVQNFISLAKHEVRFIMVFMQYTIKCPIILFLVWIWIPQVNFSPSYS